MRRLSTLWLAMTWLVAGMPHALAGHPAEIAARATLKSITLTDPSVGKEVLLQVDGAYSFKTIHTPEGALYVDLLGAKLGGASPSAHWANGLFAGYQLIEYTDPSGEPVVRVEIQTRGPGQLIAERGSSGLRLVLGQSTPASGIPAPPAKGAGVFPVKTTEGPVVVSDVVITLGSAGEVTIDVAMTKPATFHISQFDHPNRLVVDVEGARNGYHRKSIPVSSPVVKEVRVGQFQEKNPEVVRVVADLLGDPVFDAHGSAGGVRIEVKPRPMTASRAVAPAPTPTFGTAAKHDETAVKHDEMKPNQQAAVVPARQVTAPPAPPVASAAPAPRVQTAAKHDESKPIQQAAVVPARQVTAPPAPPVASAAPAPAPKVQTAAKHDESKPIQQAAVVPARQVTAPPAPPVASAAPAPRVETAGKHDESKPIQQAAVAPAHQIAAPAAPTVASAAPAPAPKVETAGKHDESKPIQQTAVVPARQVTAPPAPTVASAAPAPAPRVETAAKHDEGKPIQQAAAVPARQLAAPTASAAPAPQTEVIPERPSAALSPPAKTEKAPKPDYNATLPPSEGSREVAAAPRLTPQSATPEAFRAEKAAQVLNAEATANLSEAQGTAPAGSAPPSEEKPRYTGEPISLNLKDVDLKDFFRLIHEISGLNILVDPNVTGSVTTVLDNVPWDQALEIVLKDNGLGKVLEGNVLRIAKLETLVAEEETANKMAKAHLDAAPLVTAFRPVNYAKASSLATLLRSWTGGGALTKRGSVLVDERTNTLIISDIASQIPIVQGIVTKLDTKTKQVAIEARIVLANSSFQRTLAAALVGGLANRSGSTTGVGQTGTGASVTPSPPGTIPPTFTVPSNAATGFGVVAVTNFSQRYMIDAAISAAEIRSQAKTISRPSIITQNNVEGMVQQGTQIPVQTSINNTVAVQYVNATLQLTVTPQVTDDGHIFLRIAVQNASPGTIITNAAVSINLQQATTQVLVPDGGTVVFGGVTVTQRQNSSTQIPVLGNIPILGNLFKTTNVQDSDQELLFFVSPRLLTT